ncbi:MAG: hypothetical protein WBM07_15025, partial [Chitinivibrionales bacterium]
MNNDDSQRMNMQNPGMRKPMAGKYPSKNPNYSPSASFNYSPQSGYNGGGQMHPRRRVDRFRREALNTSERTIKQNDIIIRLLKEIRDRLPGPPIIERKENFGAEEESENWDREDNAQSQIQTLSGVPEKADETGMEDAKNNGPVDSKGEPDIKNNEPVD